MARWKLLSAHYLNVPGTEWEYKEEDPVTKKAKRKVFNVPQLLDPENDKTCHNYEGECIVAYGDKQHQSRDIIFLGPPGPEMEPLDEEAEAISKAESHRWYRPAETINGGSYTENLVADFQAQLTALQNGMHAKPAAPVAVNQIDPDEFNGLKDLVKQLMESNAALQARVLEKAESGPRRL